MNIRGEFILITHDAAIIKNGKPNRDEYTSCNISDRLDNYSPVTNIKILLQASNETAQDRFFPADILFLQRILIFYHCLV